MNVLRRRRLEMIGYQLEIATVQLIDIQEDEIAARDNVPQEMEGSPIYARANKYVMDLQQAIESLQAALAAIQEARE